MSTFLSYAIPGVPFGCAYAVVAIGLVLTYRATGVFNFAFGAQAYASAMLYTVLTSNGMNRLLAAFVAVGVVAPIIGLLLDRYLFSHIRSQDTTAKVVTALAIAIGLPSLVQVIFSNAIRFAPPPILSSPSRVLFHLGSTPINGTEVSTVLITALTVAVLTVLMTATPYGLRMRAAVESTKLLELRGVSSAKVSSLAWVLSSTMAGLAGVLLAPQYPTVDQQHFNVLLIAALAAAAVGGLRSLPMAFAGGIGLGIVEGVASAYLDPSSVWHAGLLPALPFVLLAVLLVADPRLRNLDSSSDPLSTVDPPARSWNPRVPSTVLDRPLRLLFRFIPVAAVILAFTSLDATWTFTVATGFALAICFLSITLLTGAGGQLSLCQAAFAGVGAFSVGQLAANQNVSVIAGALIGAAIAAVAGTLAAFPALRLRGLPLALLTLAFALLADAVIFPTSWVAGPSTGLQVPRPMIGSLSFATDSSKAMLGLFLVFLLVVAWTVRSLLRGTTGRFLSTLRTSPVGAASIGVNPARTKIFVFALSAGIAGLGGGLSASLNGVVSAVDFNTQFSWLWVVVVATVGMTSIEGALVGGLALAVGEHLLSTVSNRFSPVSVLALVFALGALSYPSHPEGLLAFGRHSLVSSLEARWPGLGVASVEEEDLVL